jgi:cellobiose phosphorylase
MAFAKMGDNIRAWEIMNLINPINHAGSPEEIAKYRVEPYVIAADIYAMPPHIGRGGWTWYTGSAGWMYRLIVESLLGLKLEVDKLYIKPCIPSDWNTFRINYRFRGTTYSIKYLRLNEDQTKPVITVDGVEYHDEFIILIDDHREHQVELRGVHG